MICELCPACQRWNGKIQRGATLDGIELRHIFGVNLMFRMYFLIWKKMSPSWVKGPSFSKSRWHSITQPFFALVQQMSHFDINTRNEKKIEKDHIHVEHIRNVRRHFWNLPFCPCLGRSPLSRNPRNHCHWAVCVQPWLACHFMDIFCGGLDWRWWAVALPSLELLLHCCWCMPGKNCCLCSLTPKIHKDLNPFCGIVFVFLSGLKLMAAEDRT